MLPTSALSKLFEWSRSYLNRDLVEKFIAHLGIYPVGTLVRLENHFVGVVVDHGEKDLLHPVVRAVVDARKARPITPIDIDRELGAGYPRGIVACESPEKWKIRPEDYLW